MNVSHRPSLFSRQQKPSLVFMGFAGCERAEQAGRAGRQTGADQITLCFVIAYHGDNKYSYLVLVLVLVLVFGWREGKERQGSKEGTRTSTKLIKFN